ncbi:MAG: hypothetical protein HYU63_06865, partial [Armatimonadetes bacterium]|nr:hypothetical protein [Armatimonadota bacterium]
MGIGNTGDNFEYCVPKIEPPKTTQDGSILFPNGTKYSPANKPIVSAPSTPPTDLPPGVKLPMPEILTPGIAAEPLLPVDTIFSQEGALVSAPLEDNLEIFSEEV